MKRRLLCTPGNGVLSGLGVWGSSQSSPRMDLCVYTPVWVDLCAWKTWRSVLGGAEPVWRGRIPAFPGKTSAITTSEKQDYLPASLSSLDVGIYLLPGGGSEQAVILRVLLRLWTCCSAIQSPFLTAEVSMSVCSGTGTGTGITHTASTEGWAVLSLSCSQHMRGTNHLRIQHSQCYHKLHLDFGKSWWLLPAQEVLGLWGLWYKTWGCGDALSLFLIK